MFVGVFFEANEKVLNWRRHVCLLISNYLNFCSKNSVDLNTLNVQMPWVYKEIFPHLTSALNCAQRANFRVSQSGGVQNFWKIKSFMQALLNIRGIILSKFILGSLETYVIPNCLGKRETTEGQLLAEILSLHHKFLSEFWECLCTLKNLYMYIYFHH